jgi:hypothetical protein
VRASIEWRTGQSGAPPDTVGAPATSPGHWVPTVGASDNGATGQSGGALDSHYSLSGAPSSACSDSARAVAHCSVPLFLCRRPLAQSSCYSAGTPDSPVLHWIVQWIIAERPPQIPEGGKFGVELPGAPDSSVCQTRAAFGLSFALFIWTLSWTFYWFVLNLWHL